MSRSPFLVIACLLLGQSPALAQGPSSQPSSQPASEPAPASQPVGPAAGDVGQAAGDVGPVLGPMEADPTQPVTHEAQYARQEEAELIEEDLETRVEVFRRGDFSLQMGGMIQVQGAFYVGDEAGLDLDDPADTEGFRVRRARFGLGGQLLRDWSYYLAVDLKDAVVARQGGDQGNEILDAKVTWHRFSFARVTVGVDKVPFSAFSLQSSSRLVLIERPLMVRHLAPDRRVGLTVDGEVWRLQYAVGLFNGSEGVTSGNRLAGLAGGAHVQLNLLGKPRTYVPHRLRIGLGSSYLYDDGPAVNRHRVGGNLQIQGFRTRLVGELLWTQTRPDSDPTGGSVEAGESTRWGVAGEAGVFVWKELLQVALRYEYYRDVEDLPTFGTQQIITAGLNLNLYRDNLKLQLNYINRDEREGPKVKNDIGFAQLQALF